MELNGTPRHPDWPVRDSPIYLPGSNRLLLNFDNRTTILLRLASVAAFLAVLFALAHWDKLMPFGSSNCISRFARNTFKPNSLTTSAYSSLRTMSTAKPSIKFIPRPSAERGSVSFPF